ncbi:MAG: amino acid permease [Melioribacteraceae bacterium]
MFFPAVTGFESGVSMSGDLKDPKKSIPVGTISAIIIGLVVYIGLAAFFAYNVTSDQLINNPNILLEISFFPPLLVAGIWGATLSSAIGSILGAPRILQATSFDKITPKIFSKGFGPSNEPRNALLLTFFIAEVGILIGELNLIARIVSMFFITTYGFLNISSTIEKLTSSDFRPSFKIPAWVSILGSLVSIFLMLELDFVALIGAIIIMGAIFLFLKKKELTLESGDTWEGVWSSVLRSGLNRLNITETKQRNWRPNIILFSGGTDVRPHLIEFGRWLVKKRGILSNFNLIENKSEQHLIKLPKNLKEKNDQFEGIFSRQIEVNDIYDGMETITKLYGFAGIEPNSVMLGWARESENPHAFTKLLRTYQKLNYNIFILDYDREKKFGDCKTIDLWWRGSNNNATLALTIIKFLQMEDDWENSNTRIFIITDDSSIHNRVYKNVEQILDEHRISAQIKIINNLIENKPANEIIKIESQNTDLVIFGLPEIEKDFNIIENTDKLLKDLNTVLLIHASSFFKPIYIGIENKISAQSFKENIELIDLYNLPLLKLPGSDLLAKTISDLQKSTEDQLAFYQKNYLKKILLNNIEFINNYKNLIQKSFSEFLNNVSLEHSQKIRKNISKIISTYLFNSNKFLQKYQQILLPEQKELLDLAIQNICEGLQKNKDSFQEFLVYEIEPEKVENSKSIFHKVKSVLIKPKKIKIQFDRLLDNFNKTIEQQLLLQHIKIFGINNYQLISDIQKLFNSANDSFLKLANEFENDNLKLIIIQKEQEKIERKIAELTENIKLKENKLMNDLNFEVHQLLQKTSDEIQIINVNKTTKQQKKALKKIDFSKEELFELPFKWALNQNLIANFFIEDVYIKNYQNRITVILNRFEQDICLSIDNDFLDEFEKLKSSLEELKIGKTSHLATLTLGGEININEIINSLTNELNNAAESVPEQIEILDENSFQKLEQNQFSEISSKEIKLKHYLNFVIESELLDSLEKSLNNISNGLEQSKEIFLDLVRFINYNISQKDEIDEQNSESFITVIQQSLERVESEIKNIENHKTHFSEKLSALIDSCFERLNPFLISKSVGDNKPIFGSKESREIIFNLKAKLEKIKINLRKLLVGLVYKKSEGILLAKKLNQSELQYEIQTGKILDFVSKLEPKFEIINSLPFYYKQLFIGKYFKSKEFLIPREIEIKYAEEAVKNFSNGYKGGLLILGNRFSGKTTLSNTIANKFFDNKKIYQINALESGSCSIEDFEKQFVNTFGVEGNTESILNQLSNNSVIIFDDLELWWESSVNGFDVIEKIMELIQTYSSKIFFIVNINQHAFQFINRIYFIESVFLKSIQCQPFDAEEIKEAILLRHKSTGIKYEYLKQNESEVSQLTLAKLFNSYFEISEGNIGVAVLMWIANIAKISNQVLVIHKPEIIKIFTLNNISNKWKILLQQFVYHKFLTKDRIQRILTTDISDTNKVVDVISRNGLLVELQNNIYSINPYIHHSILKLLLESDLI